MPWRETAPMAERMRFVTDWERDLYSMVELCERYGVSRKTGYKWLARYEADGPDGLRERSRAPHQCPHRIAPEVATLICAARRQHPSWGPAKLVAWLRPRQPAVDWPAVSTVGDLLARRGLVRKRRRRRYYQHPGIVPATTTQPNDLWTADFKGHFRTRDGLYCYPLTIADQHTRYLLACHGLLSTKGQGVRPVFDRLFREYGLPRAIRTDNGVPFATTGIHGLSQLNVWWLRLGIQHQRILPAHPQQNGAHERMHKTQGGGVSPAALAPRYPAAGLHHLPPPLQRGAAPRGAARSAASHAVPPLTPRVHRHPAAGRVPRALHREARDQRRHHPPEEAAVVPRQRAQATPRRA